MVYMNDDTEELGCRYIVSDATATSIYSILLYSFSSSSFSYSRNIALFVRKPQHEQIPTMLWPGDGYLYLSLYTEATSEVHFRRK